MQKPHRTQPRSGLERSDTCYGGGEPGDAGAGGVGSGCTVTASADGNGDQMPVVLMMHASATAANLTPYEVHPVIAKPPVDVALK